MRSFGGGELQGGEVVDVLVESAAEGGGDIEHAERSQRHGIDPPAPTGTPTTCRPPMRSRQWSD
jgi:hypothetical protein